MWLYELKTESQENVKSSSGESDKPPELPKEDSFILEPDIVMGNLHQKLDPIQEVTSNFLSKMAGYIMTWMKSEDVLIKVPVPRKFREKSKSKTGISRAKVESVVSVEKEACVSKKRKRKRKSSLATVSGSELTGDEHGRLKSKKSKLKTSSTKSRQGSLLKNKHLKMTEEEGEVETVEPEEEENEEEMQIQSPHLSFVDFPPGSYLATHFLHKKLLNWAYQERDQSAEIIFKSGNRYYGRLSRTLMEGEGRFIWANGMIYKGFFKNGQAQGRGEIYWPDGSWYEGDMVCNRRHGHGITHKITDEGTRYHYGEWYMGKKHGKGVTVYGEGNWYDGEWQYGKRDGHGTRRYASGALYCGEWSNGMRSGEGTMIWPNNDVYTGSWKMGFMHGYGKYTWKAFRNNKFVAPLLNTFKGHFFEGRRLGYGLLELATGATVYTKWANREKNGNGEILCRNGNRVADRNLFFEDRAVEVTLQNVNNRDLPDDRSDDIDLLNLLDETELEKRVKPRFVDINSPVQDMDFSMHISKLLEIDYSVLLHPSKDTKEECTQDQHQCEQIRNWESDWLRKVVMKRMSDLTTVYNFYATLGVDNEQPKFTIVLLRVMLWQLLRDCGLSKTNLSCVDFDHMVGIGTNPFDKVLIYEMIHYLLTLCRLTRLSPKKLNKDIPGVLAASFDLFIDEVVLNSMKNYDGTFLRYLRHMPLKAIYKLYSTFELPLTVERLCLKLLKPPGTFNDTMPLTPEYFKYVLQGSNTINPDGDFSYVPYEDPYFDPKRESLKAPQTQQIDFNIFGKIGPHNIIRAIREVVPEAIDVEGELNGSHLLSFLDFCDILVNFGTIYLDMCEEVLKYLPDRFSDDQLSTGLKKKLRATSTLTAKTKMSAGSADTVGVENHPPSNPWRPKTVKTKDVDLEKLD